VTEVELPSGPAGSRPTAAVNCANQFDEGLLQPSDPDATLDWDVVLERLSTGPTCWLTVLSGPGKVHTRPVLTVVADGVLVTSSGLDAVKTPALENGEPCSVAASTGGLDIVWNGTSAPVTDPSELERVVVAYRDQHGWDVEVDGDALTAPYGAPSAGPPPYRAFQIVPTTVFGFGTDEDHARRSTKWSFE